MYIVLAYVVTETLSPPIRPPIFTTYNHVLPSSLVFFPMMQFSFLLTLMRCPCRPISNLIAKKGSVMIHQSVMRVRNSI